MILSVLGIVGVLILGVMSPGPSFLFIAQRSVSLSRADGLAASLGMGLGGVFFAVLALLGLHSLLKYFPFLYLILKVLGGLYLLFLAWKIWRSSSRTLELKTASTSREPVPLRSFLLGLATQISNPKTAVVYGSIFASLLPPVFGWDFIALLLPAVFAVEAGWYSFVALALSAAGPRGVYLRLKKVVDRSVATVLGLLGVKLLASPLE